MTAAAAPAAWRFPDADRFMRAELSRDGYQRSHLEAGLRYVTDWRCAADIGAHVGTWAKHLSARFHVVIAAEPSLDTFECLTANMRAFGCQNVACHNVAVGRRAGSVSLALDPKEIARANTGARYVTPGGDVPCETIDGWQLPALGFLKLDVEGSEFSALSGAVDTIQRCRPIVLFEAKGFGEKRYGERPDAVPRLLESLGYYEREKVGHDHIWGPR